MKSGKPFILIVVAFLCFFLVTFKIKAQNCDANCQLQQIQSQISEYQNKLNSLKAQSNTLSNQIAQFDAQIKLAELKIQETENQITLLASRIDQLQGSLDSLSKAYDARVVESYKMDRVGEPLLILVTANNLREGVSRFFYLQKIQQADHNLLVKLSNAQNNYKKDKVDMEDLKKNLQDQEDKLSSQKSAKSNLLAVTKNDEVRYQQLLASAQAELEAIQAIIAGKGTEQDVGHVGEGSKIASVIDGPSCNSGGTHTHFIVSQNGSTQNPFNYLRGGVDYENCSGSSCGSSDGDPFNPSGSWNWPVDSKIKFAQGYGSTWAVKNTWVGQIYNFHNGIDIQSESNSEVHAVKSGELYRGSYSGQNGCALRYVRVHHDEAGLDTFYLHVNY
ncbi:MAG: hypothetical protein HY044_02470 [Candidatus Woesebacteria bacterium]|nr:MAG: hypothetical protein HY044_02470 [Candidatus Woesebacteria bacterium]